MRAKLAQEGVGGLFEAAAIPLADMGRAIREGVVAEGPRAWLRRLVSEYLRWHYAHAREWTHRPEDGVTEEAAAHEIVRRACLRSALMGGATGLVSTTASILTAQTSGAVALVALPAAGLCVGLEALSRLLVHLEMICELADVFGLRFEPDEPSDLWALLALSFGPGRGPSHPPRPGDQILKLAKIDPEDLAKWIGRLLAGESVARNAVPFVNLASSSLTNWFVTRRLGDNTRRYARYRRAFDDALSAERRLAAHLDLLIEGVWFIFVADGRLEPEESALLAALVRRCDPAMQSRIATEIADDITWVQRLTTIPPPVREPFLRVMEVAAAVDKSATLRERKLLEHAARALGTREDFSGLEQMMSDFEHVGVLSNGRRRNRRAARHKPA